MARVDLEPDVLSTLRILDDHGVELVVIGDVADALHDDGAGFVETVAIVPSGYARNLDRLAGALRELRAQLRVPGQTRAQPLALAPHALRELGRCTLVTEHADVELDLEPAGTAGYPDLFADARRIEVGERLAVTVASTEDLDRLDDARARHPVARPDGGPRSGRPTRASARRASPSAGPATARGRARARPR
ncbi:MAG: hypothetical protein H0T43_04835 [Solirubrobacterales bacterium]|nr:hypothetical protein [Solirubrobacterales bacterium]